MSGHGAYRGFVTLVLALLTGTAWARPVPLPVWSVGPARADSLVVRNDGVSSAAGGSGLLTWRVDEVLFASRFRAGTGLEVLDPGGFILGPGGAEFSSDLAASGDGFVLVSAGKNGVFATRVLDQGEAGVVVAAAETVWDAPSANARVACRGEVCVVAWVAVSPEAQVLHTVRLGSATPPRPLAVAAPLVGRAIGKVALAAGPVSPDPGDPGEHGAPWLLAWSDDAGTHVLPLDASGAPTAPSEPVPGHNPTLIGPSAQGPLDPNTAHWYVMTELADGAFQVSSYGRDDAPWTLPAEARSGVQLCRVGDGLRVTWRAQGGTGFVQPLTLEGGAVSDPIALPHAVTALGCDTFGAVGLVPSGASMGLMNLEDQTLLLVPTAAAPLDSVALLGATRDGLALGPDYPPWLVVARQGATAFVVDIAAELTPKTRVLAEDTSSVSAAFDGAWRVAWQVGRTVFGSVREASAWSAAAPLIEDPALIEFAIGRDLIIWTTATTATLAQIVDGALVEPQPLPNAGASPSGAAGTLHCSAERCVRLRRSGSQFIVMAIELTEDGPVSSPERVVSADVDTYDAAPRGDTILIAHVRYGELLEVRTSSTGVRLGGQSFGQGESLAVAPTAAGWLLAAAQDGRLVMAAVSELGFSHAPRDPFWQQHEAYRVERSHPLLATAGADSATLLVHRLGPVGAFQSRRLVLERVAGPAPNATPCTGHEGCQSGFCVDGVCCEDACFGGRADCFACARSTLADGRCGLVAEGSPCGEVDTICDPIDRCDAEGSCVKTVADAGTACGDRGVTCRVDDRCDGLGVCIDQGLEVAGATCGLPDACGEVGGCAASGLCVRAPCDDCGDDCPPPPGCGNGVLDPGEECDAGPNNAALGNHCRPSCALPACGDGIVDQAEQCDLGADNGGETCTRDCAKVLGPVIRNDEGGCSGGADLGWWGLFLGLVVRLRGRCLRRVRGKLSGLVLALVFVSTSAFVVGCGDTTSQVPRDCEVDNGGCSKDARCTPEGENVTCVCELGFVGDGLDCEPVDPVAPTCEAGFRRLAGGCIDLDECLAGLDDCDQRCVNTEGAFRCECFDGYTAVGEGCVDRDECVLGLDECARGSTECVNTEGGYTCRCAPGFEPDSDVAAPGCRDIDECAAEHGCVFGCVNVAGSYLCTCEPGYALAADGVSCEDYDECLHETPCEGTCTNTVGGFTCGCAEGARLEPTGHCTSSSLEFTGTTGTGTFVVPDGVTALVVEAWGGQGGLSTGGRGGFVYARLPVEPGEVFHVAAGRQASGDGATVGGGSAGSTPNAAGRGGGGGGASDVRRQGQTLGDRVVVAGGGGGGGRGIGRTSGSVAHGGAGGGLSGGQGSGALGFHGAGGTQHEGGLGASLPPADTGSFGLGGTSMSGAPASGGGGGGGYFGGGAGESGFVGGAGGGGSSFVTPEAVYTRHEQGVRVGHGAVVLRW